MESFEQRLPKFLEWYNSLNKQKDNTFVSSSRNLSDTDVAYYENVILPRQQEASDRNWEIRESNKD